MLNVELILDVGILSRIIPEGKRVNLLPFCHFSQNQYVIMA